MNHTKIEWVKNRDGSKGYSWNPIVGCRGVGCAVKEDCYARQQANRFKNRCYPCYLFEPHYHEERLLQPLEVKKPSAIFCGSMSDLFGVNVERSWTRLVLKTIEKANWHVFISLTKHPENAEGYPIPRNLWFGVSINTNDDWWRASHLRYREHTLISFEPLLGPINIPPSILLDLHWIIVGAQTGRHPMQPKKEWVDSIVNFAKRYEIPLFLKDNLTHPTLDNFSAPKIQEIPYWK